MAGLGGLPGLSELLSWGTDHLTEGADYWEGFADRLESRFAEVHRLIRTSGWEGQAYEKSETRAAADQDKASGVAQRYRAAAKIAREGASNESAAQSALRYAVEDAWDAGFNVYDDGTVQDARIAATASEQAARQAQAQALAGNIRQRAVQLFNLDRQIGSTIATAIGDLTGFSFEETPLLTSPDDTIGDGDDKRHVRLVDHAWKTGPDQPPAPPSGPSGADIRRVLDKLPIGDGPEVREVRSQQDLDNLWSWMKQHGVDRPGGYGTKPGEMRNLPDGTIVGRREAADSTKQPALDVRVPGKDGYIKVHINPERGGVPEIPPSASPAPPEAPPPRSPTEPPPAGRPQPAPPAAAPPAERAPVERAPVEPPAPPPPAPRTGGFGGGSMGGGGGGPLPGQHGGIWKPTE